MPRARGWVFTVFLKDVLPTDFEIEDTKEDSVLWHSAQLEKCPETGRIHIQGYILYDGPRRDGAVRNHLAENFFDPVTWEQPWVEPRRASHAKAAAYTQKEDSHVVLPGQRTRWAYGDGPQQGKRSDLSEACDAIKTGERVEDLVYSNPQLLRYKRHLDTYAAIHLKKQRLNFQKLDVIVLWGPSCTGKTRWAYDNYPDLVPLPPVNSLGGSVWFDGYSGEETILIDDFTPNLFPRQLFLQLTDVYPMQCAIKGGFTQKQWKRVIITSNYDPNTWYTIPDPDAVPGFSITPPTVPDPAVLRRFTDVRHMSSPYS